MSFNKQELLQDITLYRYKYFKPAMFSFMDMIDSLKLDKSHKNFNVLMTMKHMSGQLLVDNPEDDEMKWLESCWYLLYQHNRIDIDFPYLYKIDE